ncbi:MAG: methionyl-tRNA formyltransferase [Chitinophagaceae bacterium]
MMEDLMNQESSEKKRLKIVFLGTSEFAVPSLDILWRNQYEIVGVITAPDKLSGRGLKMNSSPVKNYAILHHLKVMQPQKLKDPDFLADLKALQADIQVVVAFRMLPEVVWNMPPMGTINLHGSLLPQYRGAAPINWCIIHGEKETGVTTFKLKQEIDTGDILFTEKIFIREDETAGELHDRMKVIGSKLLLKTIQALENGTIIPHSQGNPALFSPQENALLRTAPKIFKADGEIDWNQSAVRIYNHIRGLSPSPGAWTTLHQKSIKLFRTTKELQLPHAIPGTIQTDHKTFLKMACKDGWILWEEVQLEGKKRMGIKEFLKGYHFPLE